MKELFLEVVTPSKVTYSGEVKSVTVPGTLGSFQVLYNHAPIISTFETGKVKITGTDGITHQYATGGGTIEVKNNRVLILAESFEAPGDINIQRAADARDRAKKRIHDARKDSSIDLLRAEAALDRAINRLKIARNYKV